MVKQQKQRPQLSWEDIREVHYGDPLFPRMQELPAIIAEALAKVGGDLKSLEGKAQAAKRYPLPVAST